MENAIAMPAAIRFGFFCFVAGVCEVTCCVSETGVCEVTCCVSKSAIQLLNKLYLIDQLSSNVH